MDESMQEKIGQIQLIQQNLENFSNQRQQFQMQQTEIETALSELDGSGKAYKIIGNIMVLTDKSKLKNDLEEKKEMLQVRVNSIEKQEEKLRGKAEEIQQEVLKSLEDKQAKKKSRENDKE